MACVGFIGIGIMGRGMCKNLIKSGRKLKVWNRDRSKAEALANAHENCVTVCGSAKEVVEKCGLTYSMLSTVEASEAVFPEIVEGLGEGKMLVDCATLTSERMALMAGRVAAKRGLFLEAPVSGSKPQAEGGQLIFLTSGSKVVHDAVKNDFDAMGKRTFFWGEEVGMGSKMKIVVNMIMGTQLNACAEGVALAEAFNLPVSDLTEVLTLGAMNSPLVAMKCPAIENQKYDPAFPLKHAQKDMRIAIGMGDLAGIALPVAAASNEQYKKAIHMGLGDCDFSAVAEASRGASGGIE